MKKTSLKRLDYCSSKPAMKREENSKGGKAIIVQIGLLINPIKTLIMNEKIKLNIIVYMFNYLIKILLLRMGEVKACIQTFFRKYVAGFLSLFPHLHYHDRFSPSRLSCICFSLKNCKRRKSDSLLPSELVPASHIRYKVPLNYWLPIKGLMDSPTVFIRPAYSKKGDLYPYCE